MKKFLFQIILMSICTVAIAETINLHWLNDNGTTYTESTCTVDDDLIIPTTPPTKYGYTFTGWEMQPFVQIEYLESTGTQYIDTGVVPTTKTNIVTQFRTKRVFINNPLFGSREYYANKSFDFWIYGASCSRLDIGSTEICIAQKLEDDRTYILRIFNNVVLLNGMYITSYNSEIYSNYPLFIFNINDGGNIRLTEGYTVKIYYFQIYDNDVLVRDFIPVLDGNGTPCMYDKVEGKFYYNAGTGDFIAGPVIGE